MSLRLITPPTESPVTLEEMQRHLNIDAEDDDELLELLIKAATALFDGRDGLLGQALMPQTWEYVADEFPCYWRNYSGFSPHNYSGFSSYNYSGFLSHRDRYAIEIPLRPIIEVTSVIYLDGDGVEQTIDAANYTIDGLSIPARIVPVGTYQWPVPQTVANAVRIRFVAGYQEEGVSDPAPTTVPENIRLAIMLTVASYHGSRGDDSSATQMDIPMAAKMLLRRPPVFA